MNTFEARSTFESWMYPGGPVFQKGQGCWLWDKNDNLFFDGTGGSGALNLGHSHPSIINAIVEQLGKISHTGCKVQSEVRERFMEKLAAFFPISDIKILPTVTGAETAEAALKIVRAFTGKRKIMTLDRSYHGKTTGALSLTWSEDIKKYSPINNDDIVSCPAPVQYAHHASISVAHCLGQCEELIKENLKANTPIAALFVEPIQATEGVLELGEEFLHGLQSLAKQYEILYVWDEIYTGFGRTGTPFYFQQMGIQPDLVLVGKALANGLPIGSVIGKKEIINSLPAGIHTSTFSGNPLACAASIAALEVFEAEQIWNKAADMGTYVRQGLDKLSDQYLITSPSRGTGLMIGFDCLDDTGKPSAALTLEFAKACLQNGLLTFKGGYTGASIRFTPSLLISKAEADDFLQKVELSCKQLSQKTPKYISHVI